MLDSELRSHDTPDDAAASQLREKRAATMRALNQKRTKRKITDSENLAKQFLSARLRQQALVKGVRFAPTVTVIDPADFERLAVDESYQRQRITKKVHDLLSVLLQGGQIPDPIDVAERPDGSWWIVDGQQRFWAHVETKRPIKAHIHKVDDRDAEVALFYALNSRASLTPKNVIKGWPGPAGVFLRRMDTDASSPLRGMIDFTSNSKRPVDASALAQAVLIATTGVSRAGDTLTSMMPRLDAALRETGKIAWAEGYVQLVAAVFGPRHDVAYGKVRILPMLALAHVAHRRFKAAGRVVFPRSCAHLRKVNWVQAVPSHSRKYIGLLIERMERLWR